MPEFAKAVVAYQALFRTFARMRDYEDSDNVGDDAPMGDADLTVPFDESEVDELNGDDSDEFYAEVSAALDARELLAEAQKDFGDYRL